MKVLVKGRQVRTETTSKGNQVHKQLAALDLGGPFPLPFWVTIRQGDEYKDGSYGLAPEAFRTNRYGSLEIDPYSVRLVPEAA